MLTIRVQCCRGDDGDADGGQQLPNAPPSVHEIRSAELGLLAVGGGHRGRFSRVEEQ